MLRTAIKSVLSNKVRLGLTALAIVLGVSLVAGTFIFTDTITAQFDGLFDDIFEGVDVTVRKAGGEFSANEEPFPASVMADIMTVDGVEFAEGGVSTFTAQLLDKDGEPIGGQGPPTLGFSWGTVESLSPVSMTMGILLRSVSRATAFSSSWPDMSGISRSVKTMSTAGEVV